MSTLFVEIFKYFFNIVENRCNAMISAYELGIRGINLEMLNKICELFDVSTDYLLCRTETRNIKEVNFANAGGLDTHGLAIEDLIELQRLIYINEYLYSFR